MAYLTLAFGKMIMAALAILFSWCIVMHGNGFAAMKGGVVTSLEVPGFWLVPYLPWISLGIYITAVIGIRRDKKLWRRWALFAAATVLCNTIIGYPNWLYNRGVHRIILTSQPSKELRLAFESHFKVKTKWYSNSNEGEVLAVSNTDFSEDMVAYIKQAEQVGAPNPLPAE